MKSPYSKFKKFEKLQFVSVERNHGDESLTNLWTLWLANRREEIVKINIKVLTATILHKPFKFETLMNFVEIPCKWGHATSPHYKVFCLLGKRFPQKKICV